MFLLFSFSSWWLNRRIPVPSNSQTSIHHRLLEPCSYISEHKTVKIIKNKGPPCWMPQSSTVTLVSDNYFITKRDILVVFIAPFCLMDCEVLPHSKIKERFKIISLCKVNYYFHSDSSVGQFMIPFFELRKPQQPSWRPNTINLALLQEKYRSTVQCYTLLQSNHLNKNVTTESRFCAIWRMKSGGRLPTFRRNLLPAASTFRPVNWSSRFFRNVNNNLSNYTIWK